MQLTQLGPYSIDRQIGKGGMGSVYEGTDRQTGQKVAIKALNPHLAQAEGFRERFEAEIESLKTLRHEGIVRLFGYGEQEGTLFYSMELIHGSSLEDELKAGRRFDWREVTDIAIQLCGALKHAHDHGIIHRDIKPANILFADDRHVKLADFGIARLFGNASSLTSAGGVLGTADYMSPEQADGRPVTARCDQYSLGGVMYALLAGRPPFRAKSLPEMLQLQRFAQAEPVGRYAPDTPKQLEGVIAQLLAKEPADRYPNTAVLARHLQAMVMALTRPTHDSFSLAGDASDVPVVGPDLHNSLALAVTQAEEPTAARTPKPIVNDVAQDPGSAAASMIRAAETRPDGDKPPADALASPAASASPAGPTIPGHAVFTTIEEDLARRQQPPARSWVAVAAPLAGLALALVVLGGLGLYLSRPATPDQLYAKISSHTDADDVDSMRSVEGEIGEFVARFPEDSRTAELKQYQQRIELDRMNRRLQLQARRGGLADPALRPVEVLYLEAMNTASSSPEQAIGMLESLIKLYSSAGTEGGDERRTLCVRLAERQLAQLREDFAKLTARQVAAIRERLSAANALATEHPVQARDMYQAIINLYGDRPWAAAVVAETREKLESLSLAGKP
jgi:eukaryotic-like serine/threonine-protein kinase